MIGFVIVVARVGFFGGLFLGSYVVADHRLGTYHLGIEVSVA